MEIDKMIIPIEDLEHGKPYKLLIQDRERFGIWSAIDKAFYTEDALVHYSDVDSMCEVITSKLPALILEDGKEYLVNFGRKAPAFRLTYRKGDGFTSDRRKPTNIRSI